MSIEKYTDHQLLAELERRKVDRTEELEELQYLCIGIIDDDGAESIILCENNKEFANSLSRLKLRARFNIQRRPIVYSVKIPRCLFEVMSKKIKEGKSKEVGEALREFSNFKNLGY